MQSIEDKRKTKLNSGDRTIIVQPMEGKPTKTNTGLTDNRLFSGDNALHAIQEPNSLWYLKYEKGILPDPFKQKFTSFSRLYKFVEDYYKRRNIEIKEVVNN